jgi:hypothetical protein
VDWYKFFFSVIFPGGNVGSPIHSAPDPFAAVYNAPPASALVGCTDPDSTSHKSSCVVRPWQPNVNLFTDRKLITRELRLVEDSSQEKMNKNTTQGRERERGRGTVAKMAMIFQSSIYIDPATLTSSHCQ